MTGKPNEQRGRSRGRNKGETQSPILGKNKKGEKYMSASKQSVSAHDAIVKTCSTYFFLPFTLSHSRIIKITRHMYPPQ